MKSKQQRHDTNIVEMVFDDEDAFVVVAGVKVAKRGLPAQAETAQAKTPQAKTPQAKTPQAKTPQAKTPQDKTPQDKTPQDKAWVSLEPGWKVFDGDGMNSIVVECNGARLRNCFIVRCDAAFVW
jgi:hypothetical protein